MNVIDWINEKEELPTLQYLALQVFFDELVYKATPESIQSVRNLIDQHLWGRVKKAVREKCVSKLNNIFQFKFDSGWRGAFTPEEEAEEQQLNETYKNYSNTNGEKDVLHEYAPLDCALDEHFDGELTIHTPIPTFDSFPKLMSIIARRSPKLKDLAIWFHHCPYKLVNMLSSTTSSSSITVMPSLENLRFECLTHLYLCEHTHFGDVMQANEDPLNDDSTNKSILGFIGKHCPVLITFEASLDFCLQKKHLLELLVNADVNKNLFPADDERWSQDSVLEGLQVPIKFLNPLCSTLQELSLHLNCFGRKCDCSSLPTLAVYAFTLRHLSKLRIIRVSADEKIGIETFKIIHKVKEMGISPYQKEFEEACRDAAAAFNIVRGQELITSPNPFTDFSLMEKLNFPIPLGDADLVRAIGSLFPHLKKATFVNGLDTSFNEPEKEKFYTEELVPLLSGWSSKIDTVTLRNVNPKFVKLILDAFGANLKALHFDSCTQIALSLLASCSKLEELSIDGSSTIKSEIIDAASHCWTSDTFLPALTDFKCFVCLGVWSPLIIERKSTKLTRLTLECCHIGSQAHNPRLEWTQIPELWPNVEMWFTKRCTGLTMTIVSKMIPRLKQLRVIQLPHSVLSQNPELTEKMTREFANRKEPVEIIDLQTCYYYPFYVCPFQQP